MKKKCVSLLLAFGVLGSIVQPLWKALPSAVSAAVSQPGDVTEDGVVNDQDVAALQEFLLHNTETISENADLSGDGIVDTYDMALLKRMVPMTGVLRINEVCSSNQNSCQDAAGNSPDWIELYNSSERDISLSGIGVSDGAKNKFKFAFPSDAVIPAGGYVLVYCDDALVQTEGEYHAAFKISASGETIYLTHPYFGELDSMVVPVLDTDVSYGCYPDASDVFAHLSCTPGSSNNEATDLMHVDMPVFSVEGGFYAEAFALGLTDASGNEILYTTDGSDPRTSATAQTYSGEISIYNNTSEPNVLSAETDITLSGYSAPKSPVDKGMVIRAVCKTPDGNYSDVATNGYFIGKTASYYSDFKVISLATDSDYLFDPDTGMYVVGNPYYDLVNSGQFTPLSDPNSKLNPTNYNREGKETEVPMSLQVFENGTLAYTADVGARLSGNWSRGYAQKSFRLYARSEYGSSKLKYEFIEGLTDMNGDPIEDFDKITVRNGGTDNQLLHFKDLFIQQLCADRALALQGGEPCIVFLDGEFWGFYFLREKQDADYVEAHYHIDKDNVTSIKNGFLDEGAQAVADEYNEFLSWAADADMTDADNYQRVCDTLDIQSFIDQVVIETYINNADWATDYLNNWIAWRATEPDASNPYADGKWRFMLYDLDFSADYFDTASTFIGFDSLNNLCVNEAEPYNFVPMFYNLLNNESFRTLFYDSYIDIMKNNFDPVSVSEAIDAFVAKYGEAIAATNTRFDQEWVNVNYDKEVEQLRYYFTHRRNLAKMYLDKLYGMEIECTQGSNLVGNASRWTYYGSGTASSSSSDNTYTMTTSAVCQNFWDVQSQTPAMTIEKGKTYTLTFEASSSTSAPLAVNVNHQVGDSWPDCFSKSNLMLTPELKTYTFTFISTQDTASNWRLCFNYGLGTGVYTIRNASLCETHFETEMVTELGTWDMYNPSGEASLTVQDMHNVTMDVTALPDERWEAQAHYSGMVLQKGKTYTYSFTIQSDTPVTVAAHIQQNYGEYSQYSEQLIEVGTEAKTYTYSFTMKEDCIDALLCFDCGNAVATVEITDISIICTH